MSLGVGTWNTLAFVRHHTMWLWLDARCHMLAPLGGQLTAEFGQIIWGPCHHSQQWEFGRLTCTQTPASGAFNPEPNPIRGARKKDVCISFDKPCVYFLPVKYYISWRLCTLQQLSIVMSDEANSVSYNGRLFSLEYFHSIV